MVDLSLAKLALIGGVAILVIGPERLPAVARVAGRLLGRLQGYIKNVKDEVNQQLTETLGEEKNAFLASTEVIRTVADDLADAEQDFSAAIANANRSFDKMSQSAPVSSDTDIRRKQRLFHQKKQRHCAVPPVWYQRTSGKKVRFSSAAARRRCRPDAAVASRFFL